MPHVKVFRTGPEHASKGFGGADASAAGRATMLVTSRSTSPSTPSAQSSTRAIFSSFSAVRHASASSLQSAVWSPVAGLHLSEKAAKGTTISPVDAVALKRALKQPRDSGSWPPPEHAYAGAIVPETTDTR